MKFNEAVDKMVAPGARRPGKFMEGVIQIWTTRQCDKSCFACTQGSNLRTIKGRYPNYITLENFEKAVVSLKDFFGVVGVFGGNPALHPEFPELCRILREHIPYHRRGLWCNHPFKHAAVMRETFNPAVSNLNVHLDHEAFKAFKEGWPESRPFGLSNDSRHSPVFGSPRDLGYSEDEIWDRVSRCDINQHWSAMIGQFRGECRAWFCEIAGAQAMLRQNDPDYPDTGKRVDITYSGNLWWQLHMNCFEDQVKQHCANCLVPFKGVGQDAQGPEDQREQTTFTWQDLYNPKRPRTVQVMNKPEELGVDGVGRTIDYLQNAR